MGSRGFDRGLMPISDSATIARGLRNADSPLWVWGTSFASLESHGLGEVCTGSSINAQDTVRHDALFINRSHVPGSSTLEKVENILHPGQRWA